MQEKLEFQSESEQIELYEEKLKLTEAELLCSQQRAEMAESQCNYFTFVFCLSRCARDCLPGPLRCYYSYHLHFFPSTLCLLVTPYHTTYRRSILSLMCRLCNKNSTNIRDNNQLTSYRKHPNENRLLLLSTINVFCSSTNFGWTGHSIFVDFRRTKRLGFISIFDMTMNNGIFSGRTQEKNRRDEKERCRRTFLCTTTTASTTTATAYVDATSAAAANDGIDAKFTVHQAEDCKYVKSHQRQQIKCHRRNGKLLGFTANQRWSPSPKR